MEKYRNIIVTATALMAMAGCIRDEYEPCPPLTIEVTVQDKNWSNIGEAVAEGLAAAVSEDLPFRDYVQSLTYELRDLSTGEIVSSAAAYPVSHDGLSEILTFPESLPFGTYEINLWGNLDPSSKSEGVSVPDNGVVYRIVLVFLSSGFECTLEFFLAAACSPVGKYGKGPSVIRKGASDALVVDEDRFAFLYVKTAREAVVRVEESRIETCQDVFAFGKFARTELGKSLADDESVVRIPVRIRIRHDIVSDRSGHFYLRTREVHFQDMHLSRDIRPVIRCVLESLRQLYDSRFSHLVIEILRPVHHVVLRIVSLQILIFHGIVMR